MSKLKRTIATPVGEPTQEVEMTEQEEKEFLEFQSKRQKLAEIDSIRNELVEADISLRRDVEDLVDLLKQQNPNIKIPEIVEKRKLTKELLRRKIREKKIDD